jgi:hypothetical protein
VRGQAGMEGVGFDQLLLSPARFLEGPPSQAAVPKPGTRTRQRVCAPVHRLFGVSRNRRPTAWSRRSSVQTGMPPSVAEASR